MKKLNALLVGLMIAGSAMAQLTPVDWFPAPSNTDWAKHPPVAKQNVDIYYAPGFVWNSADFDFEGMWAKLGTENICGKQTEGTASNKIKSSWKAFYNDDYLFVICSVVDENEELASKGFEVMTQTAYADRYEADFTAAAESDSAKRNAAYYRYIPLGGIKFETTPTGYLAKGNKGDGTWSDDVALSPEIETLKETNGKTTYFLFVLPFESALAYKNAPADADFTAFDPTVKPKISFDVKGSHKTATPDAKYESWWNSPVNNGYTALVYSGYLTFLPNALGVKDVIKSNLISKIGKDEISFTKAVNANIYNVMGQQVKSVKNADRISISGLANGVYIVKAGNSSFKFVKK